MTVSLDVVTSKTLLLLQETGQRRRLLRIEMAKRQVGVAHFLFVGVAKYLIKSCKELHIVGVTFGSSK